MLFSSVPPRNSLSLSRTLEGLFDPEWRPSRALSHAFSIGSGTSWYPDTVRCAAIGAEVLRHRQEQLTQTLFSLCWKFEVQTPLALPPFTRPWAASSSSIERSRRGAKGPDQSYALGCYVYCINAMFRLLTMGGEGQLRTSRLFSSLWKNNSLYSKFPDPILASKSEGTLDHTYFRTENQGTQQQQQ